MNDTPNLDFDGNLLDDDLPDFEFPEDPGDEYEELWPDDQEEYENLSKHCWYCGAELVDGKCPRQEEGHKRETS